MTLSNTQKRRIGVRYAKKHGLDYNTVYHYVRDWCDAETEEELIEALDHMDTILLSGK